jgi:hypothetical protein
MHANILCSPDLLETPAIPPDRTRRAQRLRMKSRISVERSVVEPRCGVAHIGVNDDMQRPIEHVTGNEAMRADQRLPAVAGTSAAARLSDEVNAAPHLIALTIPG